MPRKAFIADLAVAASQEIPGVIGIARGEEDGEVNFEYTPDGHAEAIGIQLIATDVSGYPHDNTFYLCTTSDNTSQEVNVALEQLQDCTTGSKILDTISRVTELINKMVLDGPQPPKVEEKNSDDVDESDEDLEFWPEDSYDDSANSFSNAGKKITKSKSAIIRLKRKIMADLTAVRSAGFKIGILDGMTGNSSSDILSLSIQISRLGLSDEAIQGWGLERDHYIVILILYNDGYRTFEDILTMGAKSAHVEFRIGMYRGLNKYPYKPTLQEARAAFTTNSKDAQNSNDREGFRVETKSPPPTNHSRFDSLFISSSLNEFMNNHFISLIKIRWYRDIGWDAANLFLKNQESRHEATSDQDGQDYIADSKPLRSVLPHFLTADHLAEAKSRLPSSPSLPLIALQFALRYLVHCTEFCLVCHCRTTETFEALRPYVCSNPLCLYQYMSLGFGPSIEHEILTQPYVVDLLVSLCYASTKAHRFREFPSGLSLCVPGLENPPTSLVPIIKRNGLFLPAPKQTSTGESTPLTPLQEQQCSFIVPHKVKFDANSKEIVLQQWIGISLHAGEWIVLVFDGARIHYRIVDYTHPVIKVVQPGIVQGGVAGGSADARWEYYAGGSLPSENCTEDKNGSVVPDLTRDPVPASDSLVEARMIVYDKNFDDFTDAEKCDTMAVLLELIPSVKEMAQYLSHGNGSNRSLKGWVERFPPAALGILRWIIASNRSCIVQVDKCPGEESEISKLRLNQSVSNMKDWVQFRFAQGAPDKEQRFHLELHNSAQSIHPTVFAWHGSSLANWHSIIRQGLDFKETLSGRAFGHGVYHALDLNTSVMYATPSGAIWPGSELRPSQVVSMNEIVNAPDKYISKTPHLVVQHVDWIQCRYLFVKSNVDSNALTSAARPRRSYSARGEIEQDPQYTIKGINRLPVGIPQNAFPASRNLRPKGTMPDSQNVNETKRLKVGSTKDEERIVYDESDPGDLAHLMCSDDEDATSDNDTCNVNMIDVEHRNAVGIYGSSRHPLKRNRSPDQADLAKTDCIYDSTKTSFIPKTLDQASLPMLQEPAYATSNASKALNRELKNCLKVQVITPLEELGWYINGDLISNIYQWIVELHSFDKDLPLAKDMEKAGITSIVCEIRFPKDYPMSPPFVRVIRPKFLPFIAGGGGHVTGGGSMCMELLTNSGWSPASSIEGVLLQVRLAMSNLEPRPARLHGVGDYGTAEAINGFLRAATAHGWKIPTGFQDFAKVDKAVVGGTSKSGI